MFWSLRIKTFGEGTCAKIGDRIELDAELGRGANVPGLSPRAPRSERGANPRAAVCYLPGTRRIYQWRWS